MLAMATVLPSATLATGECDAGLLAWKLLTAVQRAPLTRSLE